MPATIRDEAQGLVAQELVEMFIWDDTIIGGNNVLRWHSGTTFTGRSVIWQGQTYLPFPIKAEGFQISSNDKLPRPTLSASNIDGRIGAYIRRMRDALGARVTRKRTFAKFLDPQNFPDGNPYTDTTQGMPDEVYYVARKVAESISGVEMELAVRFDVMGTQLPRRQVLAQICPWVYRSAECTYGGPPVQDINGNPAYDYTNDQCRKTIDACKARFGPYGILPHGGFPASLLVRR
jgi:lambda family phage minor tail protein L